MIAKIICFFKKHKRGKTTWKKCRIPWNGNTDIHWFIECKRCGEKIDYISPRARLIGVEIQFGFDGT